MSEENLKLTFPGGLVTKTKIGETTLITDYPEERGGNGISFNPWKVFLSAILTCQGVNLAKYCQAHNLDYSDIELELKAKVEDTRRDEFPEYDLKVTIPDNLPEDSIADMVQSFMDCPVVNHLTELKPIMKTYVNGELMGEKRR
ncbi:MAG: OsmC family protein [Aerococcus sanguinicola]